MPLPLVLCACESKALKDTVPRAASSFPNRSQYHLTYDLKYLQQICYPDTAFFFNAGFYVIT